jgi:hypothetical protein
MDYIKYTYYYIIYLGRTRRNKSIYEYIGTSEREEEFPGDLMEKPRKNPRNIQCIITSFFGFPRLP